MDETEIDHIGRRAAQALVSEVDRRVDVEDALQRLHSERLTTMVALDVDRADGPIRRRARVLQVAGIAAAVALLVGGGVALVRHEGPERLAPIDSVPVPVTTASPTTLATDTSGSTSTSTVTTEPIAPDVQQAVVTLDGTTPTVEGETIYSTVIANTHPYLGAVTPSGRVFVAQGVDGDQFREIVDGQLVDTGIPFAGGLRGGLDERLYSIDYTNNELVVWAQGTDGAWSVQQQSGPVNDCFFTSQPDHVSCGDVTVPIDPPADAATVSWPDASTVTSTSGDLTNSWAITLVSTDVALDDCVDTGCEQYVRTGGTGVAWTPLLYSDSRSDARFVSLLRPDLPPVTAWLSCGGECQIIGADTAAIYTVGYVAVDSGQPTMAVRRFAFADIAARVETPDTGIDALVGFATPPEHTPTLDDVPLLLPTFSPPVTVKAAFRTEYADDAATLHDYTQTWIGSGADAGLLTITTNLHQGAADMSGDSVHVAPWDRAAYLNMAPGFAGIVLRDPSGDVVISGQGVTRAQVLAIASGMTLRTGELPGWNVQNAVPNMLPVHEGWGLGAASRFVRWTADAGAVGEMWIVHGVPTVFENPFGSATTQYVEIGGEVLGVAYDLIGRAAVVWSPQPDVTVLLGLYGSVDDAIALAQSVRQVDEATWTAASSVDTGAGDGCASMFC